MKITTEAKKNLFKEYGGSDADTGSIEANIAILTGRIQHITGHLQSNKKDNANTRSLTILVGKRRRLLKYLANKDITSYRKIIEKLDLRK